ncbi:MAG TPA: TetR family transcriptional regulator [Solirubrobacterales bacterium]
MTTKAAATTKPTREAVKGKQRDAEATKRRILDAATAEFAAHGIAGARVDRIAAAAGANKSLIYAYFGNKDGLFDAVFDAAVTSHIDQVPIDVDDLPGYATRLYDHRLSHPELMRLADWDRLERDGIGAKSDVAKAAQSHKVKALARAQKEGKLPITITAEALLEFVLAFCQTGLDNEPGTRPATAHRKRIAAGVAQLVES